MPSLRPLLLGLILALPGLAKADWPPFLVPPKTDHTLLLNPFFWAGYGGIHYERSINRDLSWNAGIDGGFWGVPGNYYRSVGLSGGVSWWVRGDFWKHPWVDRLGWFFGPQLHVRNVGWNYTIGPTGYDVSGNYFGAGGQGGYQWIFAPGLTVRLFAEAGYMAGTLDSRAGAPSVTVGGPYINPSAAVGWSF